MGEGIRTLDFNLEELDERNKEFRIKKAKELLETEGIIEPIEPDYSKGI